MLEKIFPTIVVCLLIGSTSIFASEKGEKTASNGVLRAYTDKGSIRLSVSSFGTIGSGFQGWPAVPSCEYPSGSGIEHLFIGGLWLGGIKNTPSGRTELVSSGAVDVASVLNLAEGFEFSNDTTNIGLTQLSSLTNDLFYSPRAVSHRDFLSVFTDTNLIEPTSGQRIPNHEIPLGVVARSSCYSWNFPFADFFAILVYDIKNVSSTPIDSFHVGYWADMVVRNTKVSRPSGSAFFSAGGNGVIDSLRTMYEWDAAGDNGLADTYVALSLLGSSPSLPQTFYNSWGFRNTASDEWQQSPATDVAKFKRMATSFAGQVTLEQAVPLLRAPLNRSSLLSAGALKSLNPGDSISVSFAIVAAKKPGNPRNDDSVTRRTLLTNIGWATRAYNGTDVNGNNRLDTNEVDLRGDGSIVRYILPTPPPPPAHRYEIDGSSVTLYWTNSSERSRDLLSNRPNFEGYRIYRSDPADQFAVNSPMGNVASFDVGGNSLFFDNGFESVTIKDNDGNPTPKVFDGDSNRYTYAYKFTDLKQGWLYRFALTTFSNGDELSGLPSLESSSLQTEQRIVPGVKPIAGAEDIGIYPNPYYVSAAWDARQNPERGRKIYFYNLPKEARISVFNLAGDLVRRIDHFAGRSEGNDIDWFNQVGVLQSSLPRSGGGQHAWDLISDADQALASGLYIVYVEDLNTGQTRYGRFLVVK